MGTASGRRLRPSHTRRRRRIKVLPQWLQAAQECVDQRSGRDFPDRKCLGHGLPGLVFLLSLSWPPDS